MKKVVCPHCGAEYLPQEIFILTMFNDNNIIKDEEGKLLTEVTYDTHESYICDYCNKTFYADMNIDFTTDAKLVKEYVTKLHKPALFLSED